MRAYGTDSMDQLAIDTIRTLAMDAVQAAESGHPGTPMALAPVGTTGARIAMVSFGASAPYKDLFRHFGFTVAHVLAVSKRQIEQHKEIHREPADIVA